MRIHTEIKHVLADTKTPIALYLRLRDLYPGALLLESSDYNNVQGHYSYIGLQPLATVSLYKGELVTTKNGVREEHHFAYDDPEVLQSLIDFKDSFEFENQELPFCYAGMFGYSSYDAVQYFEDIRFQNKPKEFEIPELLYHIYGILLVLDHKTNRLTLISHHPDEEKSRAQLEKVEMHILKNHCTEFPFTTQGGTSSSLEDEEFLDLVQSAKHHCQIGDVFQLVLSRRFSQEFIGDEFNVYRSLKNINPSPYLFYLDHGSFKIFGSSPEAQIIIEEEQAQIHPIAGTYMRTGLDKMDLENSKKLLDDPKENAEHNMLVDLARNDLSKYCKNVAADFLKQAQFYSHVIHLVSKISGEPKSDFHPLEILMGTFPAGTLSGAPKYKAMQLIDRYENQAREFYGGCIGYISHDNKVNHAIMIRTFISKNNVLHYQAGAGITIKSDAQTELNEINNKVSALAKSIIEAEKLTNKSTSKSYETSSIG